MRGLGPHPQKALGIAWCFCTRECSGLVQFWLTIYSRHPPNRLVESASWCLAFLCQELFWPGQLVQKYTKHTLGQDGKVQRNTWHPHGGGNTHSRRI